MRRPTGSDELLALSRAASSILTLPIAQVWWRIAASVIAPALFKFLSVPPLAPSSLQFGLLQF
eukprot:6778739-Pyramimonas_sp.AAC.1